MLPSLQKCTSLLVCLMTVNAAILGDGTRSIYDGRPISPNTVRGSCTIDNERYNSETAVPRDHPCHYCICYQGLVSCYWKACGTAPVGCSVMFIEDSCNPSLYKCTVPKHLMAEPVFGQRIKPLRRFRRSNPGLILPTSEPFPVQITEEFLSRVEGSRVKRASNSSVFWQPRDKSCTILGVKYNLGEVIGVASDPCLECRCAAGDMFCAPRCCFLPSELSLGPQQISNLEQQSLLISNGPPAPHPLYNVRNQRAHNNLL